MKRNGETVEYQVALNIPHLRGKNQQNLRESPCFLREWQLQKLMPPDLKITYACSTGYGEQLLKEALGLDEGEVETIAHTTAALFFDHQVD